MRSDVEVADGEYGVAAGAHESLKRAPDGFCGRIFYLKHAAYGTGGRDVNAVLDDELFGQVHAHEPHESCVSAENLLSVDHGDKSAAFVNGESLDLQKTAVALVHQLGKCGNKRASGSGNNAGGEGNHLFGFHA